tara:strand:- start:299 stop:562 length:264 start_codon:yes stop_codon:yes gene_type:complete
VDDPAISILGDLSGPISGLVNETISSFIKYFCHTQMHLCNTRFESSGVLIPSLLLITKCEQPVDLSIGWSDEFGFAEEIVHVHSLLW